MKRAVLVAVAAAALFATGVGASTSLASRAGDSHRHGQVRAACSSGFVDAVIGGEHKCLHAGEFCSSASEPDYERYGFRCVAGHLQSGVSAPGATPTTTDAVTTTASTSVKLGSTVLLKARTKKSGCTLSALPDRRCSPGAFYSGLTQAVLCSAGFRTSSVRNVPDSEKHQVEIEYGLAPRGYGSTLEIDHIVSLELGGSNDIANLYPEKAKFASHLPGFRIKDKLENKLHDLVCSGEMTLSAVRQQIASNWEALYTRVYGVTPRG